MTKKNVFNFDKKSSKNYALINGSIINPKNDTVSKGTVLIKDKLIEEQTETV